MDTFQENMQTKTEELVVNLNKFLNKNNNSAGTKARKNSMELIKMLKELRVNILDTQKERKAAKEAAKTASSSE